jgi:hypothetical protein
LVKQDEFKEYSGDCFPSMFTHRMMSNFIDSELPTNDKIVNPGCWCENYAVRCTAEILSKTHSNLTGDSAGFYIQPDNTKDNIVSLIFGILTGNLAMIIKSAQELANPNREDLDQALYANEVAQAFEVYVGDAANPNNDWSSADGYNIKEGGTYSNVNSL